MAFADLAPEPKRRKRKAKAAPAAPVDQDVIVVDDSLSLEVDDDGDITIIPPEDDAGEEDEGSKGHDANLALKIDEMEQGRIAEMCLEGIEADKSDRDPSITMRAKIIELLGMKLDDPKSDVSGSTMGMSTSVVRDPILLEAVERGRANAYAELCPASGPAKVVNWDTETPGTGELATELEKDLNYYMTTTASEYYPDTRYMLWWTYLASGTFKKIYQCPLRRRPVSESVDMKDLIIPSNSTDLKNAGRITHEVKMRKSVLRRMQIAKVYKDVEVGEVMPGTVNAVDQKIASTEGVKVRPQRQEDQDYTIYECYCELDIKGHEHKDGGKPSGLPLPYRVTIEADSRKILEIRRNWDEDDEDYTAKIPFVLFPFSTGLSRSYGSGLGHMGGNIAAALTALLRISIDAGMAANYPALIKAKGTGRQLSNEIACPPGSVMEIDTGGLPIQQAMMGMPYKDASPIVVGLMDQIRQVGQRLLGSADLPVGEGSADIPVGTILATIEQALKVMAGAHKALHAAQSEELRLLVELFKDDPEALWRGNRRPAMGSDKATRLAKFKQAIANSDIVPQSDPNVPSAMHRKLLALGFKQLTMGSPMYDPVKVDRYVAREAYQMGDQEFDSFLAPPQQAPPDPKMAAVQANLQAKQSDQQMKVQLAAMNSQDNQTTAALKAKELEIKGHVDVLKLQNSAADRQSKENLAMVNTAEKIITATSVHPETEGAVDDQLKQWLPLMQPQPQTASPQMKDGGSPERVAMNTTPIPGYPSEPSPSTPEALAQREKAMEFLRQLPGHRDGVVDPMQRYDWFSHREPETRDLMLQRERGMAQERPYPGYPAHQKADGGPVEDNWEELVHPVTQQPMAPVGGMQ